MQKLVIAILILASPSIALAHGSNDLSGGLMHWLFSWHHLPGFVGLAAVVGGFIWWITRPEPKARAERVKR